MEEIKVGEFVRTDNGEIHKVIDVEKGSIKIKSEYKEWIGICCIAKHSFNIIDLIEVGDYVNGQEVVTVYGYDEDGNDRDDKGIIEVDDDYAYGVYLEDIKIFSIVTKEQFKSIEYEVK